MENKTNKADKPPLTHATERLGSFNYALKSEFMKDIIPENGNGFILRAPYGIITVKPTSEAIEKLITLMEKYGVLEKGGESILDCCINRNELESGNRVEWESGCYANNVNNKITLEDWIRESKVTPLNVAQQKRRDVESTLKQIAKKNTA